MNSTVNSIDAHHNGPGTYAHGGVAAGRLAEASDRPVDVRFHAPIPLEMPLATTADDDGTTRVEADGVHVATIRPWSGRVDTSGLVVPSSREVTEAEARWFATYRDRHPFPTCFGCGPRRSPRGRDEGLGLRPGLVSGSDLHATSWRPAGEGAVAGWLVWAALDCASAGPALHRTTAAEAVVTGELAVAIEQPVSAGSDIVIVSRQLEARGVKTKVAAALFDRAAGRRLAVAASTWITIPAELAP